MNRKNIQVFAAGWFAASCFAALFYLFGLLETDDIQQNPPATTKDNDPYDTISSLESDGYTVLTDEEYRELQRKVDDRPSANPEIRAILHIKKGMNSKDVASSLEQLQMIDDTASFEKTLNENEASTRIQAGYHHLHSKLTEKEIIDIITSS